MEVGRFCRRRVLDEHANSRIGEYPPYIEKRLQKSKMTGCPIGSRVRIAIKRTVRKAGNGHWCIGILTVEKIATHCPVRWIVVPAIEYDRRLLAQRGPDSDFKHSQIVTALTAYYVKVLIYTCESVNCHTQGSANLLSSKRAFMLRLPNMNIICFPTPLTNSNSCRYTPKPTPRFVSLRSPYLSTLPRSRSLILPSRQG